MLLRLFGSIDLRDDDGTDRGRAVSQPKRAALLAYLAIVTPRDFVRRDTLLALFWPEQDAEHARGSLNQAIHSLRRSLGADVIVSRGNEMIGIARDVVRCDVIDFEDALKRGDHEAALACYRAPFLDGFFLADLVEMERWLEEERSRLARFAADAAWSLAERTALTDSATALAWGERALNILGGNLAGEQAVQRLIALHDHLGDRAGALRVYDRFAEYLGAEFETEPAPETRALIASVRSREVARATPATVRAISPVASEAVPPAVSALPPASTNAGEMSRQIRLRRTVAAVAAAALLGAVGFAAARRMHRDEIPASSSRVAVFPFAYRGAGRLAYLAGGVSTLIAADLDGAGDVYTVDSHALQALVDRRDEGSLTTSAAADMASEMRAGLFVVGDIVEAGGRIRVSAELHDASGDRDQPVRASAEGEGAGIFELVDRVAAQLMAGRTKRPAEHLYRAAVLTTHSADALRAYVDGDARYREARYVEAAQSFRRAVDADSTFALAYYRLSTAANWTGESALADWAAARAVQFDSRLSAHDRADVEAWSLYLKGIADEAEHAYRAILARDSTNVEAWSHLADIHFHWGPLFGSAFTESAGEWQRVLRLDPNNAEGLVHLARVLAASQRRDEFETVAKQIERLAPDANRAAEVRVLRAFAFGDHQARVDVAGGIGQANEAVLQELAHIAAAVSPDLDDVAEVMTTPLFARNGEQRRNAGEMVIRAQMELARFRLRAAQATLDTASSSEPDRIVEFQAVRAMIPLLPNGPAEWEAARRALDAPPTPAAPRQSRINRLYLGGALSVRLGDAADAERRAAALDASAGVPPEDSAFAHRYARQIRAELLRTQRRPAEALAMLGSPRLLPDKRRPYVWSYPLAAERLLRAELLSDLGREREALPWLESFPDPNAYDVAYLPIALLRRAEIHERLGQSERAAEQYRRLLALWRDSDPQMLTVVHDVQRRLARFRPE